MINSRFSSSGAVSWGRGFRRICCSILAVLSVAATGSISEAQTWTQLNNYFPYYSPDTMILLTDGSVMTLAGDYDFQHWSRLIPDSTGSYVNGTWKNTKPMLAARQYFASNVMKDGRLFVLGGKYGYYQNLINTNAGEIYDPVADHWTSTKPFPESKFGNGPTQTLSNFYDSAFVCGSPFSAFTYKYYNYTYGTGSTYEYWYTGDLKLRSDTSLQENWVQLPDRRILSYDVNASITNKAGSSQLYDSTQLLAWSDAGTVPAVLTTAAQNSALGPVTLLPNGKVLQIGGNENTAIYTPSYKTGVAGTWVAGPSLPAGMGANGAPGAMLPNGHFVFLANNYTTNSGTILYDYDYTKNTITDLSSTLPPYLVYLISFYSSNSFRMLVLPNGHMLLTIPYEYYIWEYTPPGAPQVAWQPYVYGIYKLTQKGSYQIDGTLINGISEGACYGSGAQMSSNYPIVKLTNGSKVTYARTTYQEGIVSTPVYHQNYGYYADFTIPSGLPAGTYQVSVIANGIPSSNTTTLTYSPAIVTASFTNGTLNITGDDNGTTLNVTYTPVKKGNTIIGGSVTVTTSDPYTLLNGGQPATFNVGANRFPVNVKMGNGTNTITFNALYSTNVTVTCGNGTNSMNFDYCTVSGQLTLTGGTGTNTSTYLGSSITKKVLTNFH